MGAGPVTRLRGTPLRTRLVALLLVLVAAALLIAGTLTTAALRGTLLAGVDSTITDLALRLAAEPAPPDGDTMPPPRPGTLGRDILYVSRADATGTPTQVTADAELVSDPPALPTLDVDDVIARNGQPYIVESQSGQIRWRALTLPTSDGSGSVTVAQDISGIDSTVARLVVLELVVGAAVLLGLGVAGWVLVRRSLRPLAEMEQTAAAIAAGDLDRRAPTADPRTEVGSLARSFNTMVDDLAGALAAQQASEATAHESAARAQASEARMRRFVADAGHELRTPLTSVRGFAELYRLGAVPAGPPLDDTMSRIESEATRMGVLVEDLLLLARLDQKRPLQRTRVDVVELLSDALAAARAAAPDRVVRLRVRDSTVGLHVEADALRLRQVVDNLLSNALRYSPADQPIELEVQAEQDQGAPSASIRVRDHGPGMTPDVAERAFERFYRADAARSREDGGSGLGLAIVQAIVAAHGGHVALRTAPGAGCEGAVRLPVLAPAAVTACAAPAAPSAGQLPGAAKAVHRPLTGSRGSLGPWPSPTCPAGPTSPSSPRRAPRPIPARAALQPSTW